MLLLYGGNARPPLDKGVKWLYFQAPGDNTLFERGGLERPDLRIQEHTGDDGKATWLDTGAIGEETLERVVG